MTHSEICGYFAKKCYIKKKPKKVLRLLNFPKINSIILYEEDNLTKVIKINVGFNMFSNTIKKI